MRHTISSLIFESLGPSAPILSGPYSLPIPLFGRGRDKDLSNTPAIFCCLPAMCSALRMDCRLIFTKAQEVGTIKPEGGKNHG